jgi:predicted component of type VI protein secretion system
VNTRTYRPVPLGLTMLAALFGALVALAASSPHDAAAHEDASHKTTAATITKKELALRQDMRKLWEDHVTWTRLAVISLTTDTPDTRAAVGRLLRNQTDIGNAIKPYYGAAAGRQLTAFLREHILIAADLIAVARKGDQASVATQQARWTANADQIATLLSKANPRSWKLGPMKAMMRDHLRLTTNEVVARLQGTWAADVRAYDRIHLQILHMSDMLSDGLVEQFPNRFR